MDKEQPINSIKNSPKNIKNNLYIMKRKLNKIKKSQDDIRQKLDKDLNIILNNIQQSLYNIKLLSNGKIPKNV